jgi:hypothetical protein
VRRRGDTGRRLVLVQVDEYVAGLDVPLDLHVREAEASVPGRMEGRQSQMRARQLAAGLLDEAPPGTGVDHETRDGRRALRTLRGERRVDGPAQLPHRPHRRGAGL